MNIYYNWDDLVYAEFMVGLLDILEPNIYEAGAFIMAEKQPVVNLIFIIKGEVEVGYLSKNELKGTMLDRFASK